MNLSYAERAETYWKDKHPLAAALLHLMERKQTNLCLSADVETAQQVLDLADALGPYLCMIKTHADTLNDFTLEFTQRLLELSQKHDFLIFEDRKFADIGSTVQKQYAQGLYRIASWSHITNAHPIPGDGIIRGLKPIGLHPPPAGEGYLSMPRGLLMLAEMSSAGSLATGEYTAACVRMAQDHRDFVVGFVAGRRLEFEGDFLTFSPGVQLESGRDELGQRYRSPEVVVTEQGSDVIIVGRGILQSEDVGAAARAYRDRGWAAYRARVEQK